MVGSARGDRALPQRIRSRGRVRIDKLSLAALEATLRLYLDPARALREVPVLRMLAAGEEELRGRAELMRAAGDAGADARVIVASGEGGRRGAAAARARGAGVRASTRAGSALDELARRLRAGDAARGRARARGLAAARPAHARPTTRRARRRPRWPPRCACGRRAAAHARHRRAHRPRQDGARSPRSPARPPTACRRSAAAASRSSSATRRSSCRAGGSCRWSTCPATSASCARWSRAPPAWTCSCCASPPTTA